MESSLAPGSRIGDFVIESVLGEGGMGVVYRARDESLGRTVAVKVLSPRLAGDAEQVERTLREARAMAAIEHPNIVGVYATGEVDGTRFIAMQYVDGGSLKDLLAREGRLDVERALGIARDVASALARAHQAGIVHRDIKPDNVLLDGEGRARVADFGLARPLAAPVLTAPDSYLGTPRYSAPEQWMGGAVDARADLYALGVVLYEMLAGRPPFVAETMPALLREVLDEAPAPLAGVPGDVGELVERLLSKAPSDRPQTALEVMEMMDAGRSAEKSVPARRIRPSTGGAFARHRWWGVVICVVLAVGALALRARPASGPLAATVLDFENLTGSSEINWMRAGAPDLLITSLARYPFLRVRARETGGAEMIVSGRYLETAPGHLLLDLKITDPRDGTVLGAEQERGATDPDALLQALDRLSSRLARRMGARYEETRMAKLGDDAWAKGEGLAMTLFESPVDKASLQEPAPGAAPAPALDAEAGGGGGSARPGVKANQSVVKRTSPPADTRLQALALYYTALEAEQAGSVEKSRSLLREALALQPGLAPARQALERLTR